MDLFNQTDKGAIFSECKKYRYAIWRIWDKSKPYVMFSLGNLFSFLKGWQN